MRYPRLSVALPFLALRSATLGASFQAPLFPPDRDSVTGGDNYWKFNFSSAAPHIFASINSVLQQWPNTFFPNGHSIVPCQIPAFTKLYHGRMDGELPPSPEWLAFDMCVPMPTTLQ
jgi:hypothetical protein